MAYDSIYYNQPLDIAKAIIIRDQKKELLQMLSLTDWLVIRREDTGANIPDSVQAYRAALRSQQVTNESLINSATTAEGLEGICMGLTKISATSISAEVSEYLINGAEVFQAIYEQNR